MSTADWTTKAARKIRESFAISSHNLPQEDEDNIASIISAHAAPEEERTERDDLRRAASAGAVPAPTKKEQHLLDLYETLGVRWGDDPFAAIKVLRAASSGASTPDLPTYEASVPDPQTQSVGSGGPAIEWHVQEGTDVICPTCGAWFEAHPKHRAAPSDLRSRIEPLIQKWRKRVAGENHGEQAGYIAGISECAIDLDAAVASSPTPPRPICLCTDLRTDGHGHIRNPHPDCPIHSTPPQPISHSGGGGVPR
jgi:hypothetical protein